MSQSNELVELFKSRQTVLELLKKQGYDVSNYENASMTEVSVMRDQKQMDMLVETDTGKKAYVKYHLGKTLRANNVYDYIEDLINLDNVLQKTDDLIIIVKEDPNDSLIKVLII